MIEIGAGVAVLLVVVLISTMVMTLVAEQTAQIGTMKTLGGTRWRILQNYLLSVFIVAVIATALGLGLGLFAGYVLAANLTATVQQTVGAFVVTAWGVAVSIVVGLVAPMLAALVPIWVGTRITVREALAAYGVRSSGRVPQHVWGKHFRWIPQTVWLGLRSLFRRPGRAITTVVALTFASTIFMAAQVANTSLSGSLAESTATAAFHSDFYIRPNTAVHSQPFVRALQALPNVADVEAIDPATVTIAHSEIDLQGLPADTHLYTPHLVAGRWLEDELGTIVINDYAAQRLHIHVGQTISIQFNTQPNNASPANTVQWHVVGIFHDIFNVSGSANPQGSQGLAFTTLANLNVLRHLPSDEASRLWLQAKDHTPQALTTLRGQIQQTLITLGQGQNLDIESRAERFDTTNPFAIVAILFDAMALLVGLVGVLGLTNTLMTSVMERRHEIGMLRSLGATGWRVSVVFLIEALALAGIAWAVGTGIGVPAGFGLLQLLAIYLGPSDIFFQPSFIALTAAVIGVIVLLASGGPVFGATRIRVRDALRYE